MLKRAVVLLIVLTGLCSGCGTQAIPPVLNLPDCPAPSAPILPLLDAAEPLESPANMERLMERDDILRAYIDGLLAALSCWQTEGGKDHGSD